MKSLADYIHSKGLKFGVYTARCKFTCQLFAASFGHEVISYFLVFVPTIREIRDF
eukprot:SAG31_NODE_11524_length_1021_cov_1.351410_1_plen_54_part_10